MESATLCAMNSELSPNQHDKNTWMIVYITHNLVDAQVVRGRLESEGIMAILDHMPGMTAIGLTLGSWGEVKVLVHPRDYELALDLLEPEDYDALPEGMSGDVLYYDDWEPDDEDDFETDADQ